MKKEISVLLFSGGLDSFILNYLYTPDILLYIKTGGKYEEKELNKIYVILEKYNLTNKFKLVDLKFLKDYELDNAHIPLRNLLFLEIASFYGNIIYLGALKGETSKDKSKHFRRATEHLLSYCWNDIMGLGTKKIIKVKFPFKNMTKTQVIKKYLKNGGIVEDLNLTVSCYDGEVEACGKCMSCFRRWVSEVNNNIYSKRYSNNPYDYYFTLMDDFSGIWNKIKIFFTKRFWINLPSNIDFLTAQFKYKKKNKVK